MGKLLFSQYVYHIYYDIKYYVAVIKMPFNASYNKLLIYNFIFILFYNND